MTLQQLLTDYITVIVFIAVAVVFILGYIIIKRYVDVVLPKKRLESNNKDKSIKIVKKIIEKYIRRNDGRAIYSIEVGSNKTKGSADAILVGYFGVLVITTCPLSGTLYANDKDTSLTQIVKEERRSHDNPILKSQIAGKAVTELLREKRVFKVPVEAAVVFTGNKASVNVPRSLGAYTIEELSKVLKTKHFLEDKNVNVDSVVQALLGMSEKKEKK